LIDVWLLEFAKGAGKLFLNPLLYWFIILVIFTGVQRIKQERNQFGTKIFDVFTEWKDTWKTAVISGLLMSLLMIGAGFVFNYETVFVWSMITVILTILFGFTLLSAAYSLGFTYLAFLLFSQFFADVPFFTEMTFLNLSLLVGLFLFIEAVFISKVKGNATFPQLGRSRRGLWVGEHRLKRIAAVPFFVLVPGGAIIPFADYWPALSIGGETYGLLLVPFVIGFDHLVKGRLPKEASQKIAQVVGILAVVVLAIGIAGLWIPWLSLVAVLSAIFGRAYISYRFRSGENKRLPFFSPSNDGLKVLAVIPGTPAAKLDIRAGETVVKVNGKKINAIDEFYKALQTDRANFKLTVLDEEKEMRIVQGSIYEDDHYQLGLLFPKEPYRLEKEAK
jgi:hypothetical protein